MHLRAIGLLKVHTHNEAQSVVQAGAYFDVSVRALEPDRLTR